MTRVPYIAVTNINNELPSIMTRLPSIEVTKSQQQTTFLNDKATIHWNKKNLNKRLISIMKRLPSIRVKKYEQQTAFHNDKAIIP